jgi:hypothetical protein
MFWFVCGVTVSVSDLSALVITFLILNSAVCYGRPRMRCCNCHDKAYKMSHLVVCVTL